MESIWLLPCRSHCLSYTRFTVKLIGFSKGIEKVYFFKKRSRTCDKPFALKYMFLKGFLPGWSTEKKDKSFFMNCNLQTGTLSNKFVWRPCHLRFSTPVWKPTMVYIRVTITARDYSDFRNDVHQDQNYFRETLIALKLNWMPAFNRKILYERI